MALQESPDPTKSKRPTISIFRHGYLIADLYLNPLFPRDTPHVLHSCTKSIMSTLIDIAIEQGHIENIDVPIVTFFPDKASVITDERMTRVTLQHLLAMQRRYGYVRAGPIYHPQTDVCIMAPDGTFVAGCEALIDAWNAEADIERVCTHSEYRRRGFGRVVIQACLYRLRDMGIEKVYITGYSEAAVGLYGSLGAGERTESLIYKQTAV